ncbi:MAG: hypothetical protein ABSB60_01005 [Terracidiphilus sp.]|jgi:hypothetical protein
MAEKHMIKLAIYLFRDCTRAKQEGVVRMVTPKGKIEGHFDHLDEIPAKIRKQLETVGLTYDVADDSDNTVIEPKTRKRQVIQKIRRGD